MAYVMTACDRCSWPADKVVVTNYGRICQACFGKLVADWIAGVHGESIEIRGVEVSGEDYPRRHELPYPVKLTRPEKVRELVREALMEA